VKARSASSQGRFADAAAFLKDLPGLDKGGEQSEFLLDLYLKSSNWDQASVLALKVFDGDEKNFGLAQKVAESLLESQQNDRALALVSRLRIPMLDSGEHDAVTKLLNELAVKMPGRLEPLEWLVDSYGRTSDSFRMPDALAQLGDALAAANQLARAKEIFEQLVDRQPESDSSKRKLNDVLRRMGLPAPEEEPEPVQETLQAEIPQPEAPKLRPEIDTAPEDRVAAAAIVETQLDEETQKFIAQSLTDVDLFASYGLTQKAIGLLEAILRRTPNHTPTLEKLLDFVLGAGDDRRTAELAARLEEIHKERGDAAGAERFGELRRRFQRAAGLSDEEIAAAANPSAPAASVAAPPAAGKETLEDLPIPAEEMAEAPVSSGVPPPPKPEPSKPVHEVDLSDEWASLLEQAAANDQPAAVPPIASAAITNGKEIASASHMPVSAAPEEFAISEFQIPVENPVAEQAPAAMAQVPALESSSDAADEAIELIPVQESGKQELPPQPEIPAATQPLTPQPAAPEEIALDQEYELVLSPEQEPQQPEPAPTAAAGPPKHAVPSGSQVLASDQFLADLANEIDQLGIGELTPSFSEPAAKENAPIAAAKAEAPASPAELDHLKEVFDDFRAEIGEMGAEDEDLETHYNLGIAFREMGLLEEAISEFQKVAKANEKGKAFRYAMQCCTLLGLAFMEKGQPSIAAIWYERALHTPGVDAESTLALRYDLGVAQESANDLDAALKSFSQVYAVNIDYRGVADRIAALQKTTR
jgi:tetratricopeptide (TPR) repeat protein